MTSRRMLITASAALFLAACGGGEEPDPQVEQEEARARAEMAAYALGAGANVTHVLTYFEAPTALDPANAASLALAGVGVTAKDDMILPACVTFTTDGLTHAELSFANCFARGATLYLNGRVTGDLTVERESCQSAPCPVTAVKYTIASTDLLVNDLTVTGEWSVRHPVDRTEPQSWHGELSVRRPDGVVVQASADVSWLVSGFCVSIDYRAELSSPNGSISIAADDIAFCLGEKCPTGGDIVITYGNGETLQLNLEPGGVLNIQPPRGAAFELPLACAADPQ